MDRGLSSKLASREDVPIRMHGQRSNIIVVAMVELLSVVRWVVHDGQGGCWVNYARVAVRIVKAVPQVVALVLR